MDELGPINVPSTCIGVKEMTLGKAGAVKTMQLRSAYPPHEGMTALMLRVSVKEPD
jgi:hypothetical protein